MQREMAELHEQMAKKQRAIAELAQRLGMRRPEYAPPRAEARVPPPPMAVQPPAPVQPRYPSPGPMRQPSLVPQAAPPAGHLEQRIDNLERKLDAVLRTLQS